MVENLIVEIFEAGVVSTSGNQAMQSNVGYFLSVAVFVHYFTLHEIEAYIFCHPAAITCAYAKPVQNHQDALYN